MMENVFGVDVAKAWIDVAGPDGYRRFSNKELAGFAQTVRAVHGVVVFEASGGCEAPLRAALGAVAVPAIRVNPRRARAFANSLGRLAKTDKVDAQVLREMGQRLDLPECPPDSEEMLRLKALQLRRRQLVEDAKREKVRLTQTADPQTRLSIRRVLGVLNEEAAVLSEQIEACIAASRDLSERAQLLRGAPGIGPVVTTALLTELPELGSLTPRTVAALVGVAPMARDSGKRSGKRRIGGGRKALRDALYMAGLSASRSDPTLRAFAERLKENGKAPKQAIIAVTRKLVIILNAMIRENRPYVTNS